MQEESAISPNSRPLPQAAQPPLQPTAACTRGCILTVFDSAQRRLSFAVGRHQHARALGGVFVRLLYATTLDDMVAVFLKAEIASERFGDKITAQLRFDRTERRVVDAPDITNVSENAYRRQLLASYRAYVFDELPAHTLWYRAVLTRDEVMTIRYIDYDYWNELSDNTRLPSAAAAAIRAGRAIYGQSTHVFLDVAAKLRAGIRFPALIVVGTAPDEPLTVYEGHGRLTAYLLAPECIPEALEVVAGFAPECVKL